MNIVNKQQLAMISNAMSGEIDILLMCAQSMMPALYGPHVSGAITTQAKVSYSDIIVSPEMSP